MKERKPEYRKIDTPNLFNEQIKRLLASEHTADRYLAIELVTGLYTNSHHDSGLRVWKGCKSLVDLRFDPEKELIIMNTPGSNSYWDLELFNICEQFIRNIYNCYVDWSECYNEGKKHKLILNVGQGLRYGTTI